MLKLMYITNRPEIAKIVEDVGIERIFIDMEYIGKSARQGGMNTVQNCHTIEDICAIKKVLSKAQILVRCNPIHDEIDGYYSSKEEIECIIKAGADIVMLPYFKTTREVQKFVDYVDGRAKVLPLVETPEAVMCIDEILNIDGIDEMFIGLNDLSLGYGMKFMFQLLVDGTVEKLCNKFKSKGLPYGFGGIASIGKGMVPSEHVIAEHYRLGSTCAILSRSFCNTNIVADVDKIRSIFYSGIKAIREWEQNCENGQVDFIENKKSIERIVNSVLDNIN